MKLIYNSTENSTNGTKDVLLFGIMSSPAVYMVYTVSHLIIKSKNKKDINRYLTSPLKSRCLCADAIGLLFA